MYVRKAIKKDCEIIFKWRNDPLSQEMFINSSNIEFEDHFKWFHNSIMDNSKYLYIGEVDNEKIGISRFDFIQNSNIAEVSINLNPKFRGKGFATDFLLSAIDSFQIEKDCILIAKIKVKNIPSQKIFKNAEFSFLKKKDDLLIYKRLKSNITFRETNESDEELLFSLLKNRIYSISHKSLPSLEKHQEFVRSNPYLHWYLIYNNQDLIGSFYIKEDNSIGVNILKPSLIILKKIIYYINNNFSKSSAVPSKIAPYFFINVAKTNKRLYEILEKIGCEPIQTSFEIKS